MNTNTPETDAKSFWLTDDFPIQYSGKSCVTADFARRLERERDESRKLLRDSNRGAERNAHISQSLASQLVEARRENAEMREAIKTIYYDTEGYADGAPDASRHDRLCNEISAKLQPFIK